MKTIVVSDMTLLGSDLEDMCEGLKHLKQLINKGTRLILLSNRPEYCMRKIGVYIDAFGKTNYEYLGPLANKGMGINVIARNDVGILYSKNLKADYTIFGNGICTFDRDDALIRQDEFIKKKVLDEMIQIFDANGYFSIDALQRKKDQYGDRCFYQGEDVYKFFTPENGVSYPNSRVYGMQCSARDEIHDSIIIREMEDNISSIKGYKLNGKPCFYQRDVNKLVALNKLLDQDDINIDDCYIILSELTDNVLLKEYPKQSEVVKGELFPESTKTLAKVLKEID